MNFSIINYFKQQILLLVCCFSFVGYAQNLQLSDHAQVSVLTCGPGDEMYSIFGHTAIRISDPILGIDEVYNYGSFDFDTPNFYAKFIKGDLLYSLSKENYADFLYVYRYYNRSVSEQFLDLNLNQKQKIYDKIQHQLASEERNYKYQFINNNCTTKVADLINDVIQPSLVVNFEGNHSSQRKVLNSHLTKNYFEKLGMNLLFSFKVDKVNDIVFLPEKLMHSVAKSKNGAVKLEKAHLVHFEKIDSGTSNNWNTIYFFSIICLILAFLSSIRFFQYVVFGFIGIFGTLILVVSLYTSHQELVWNESLLFLNPLYLFLFNKRIQSKLVIFLIVLIFVYLMLSSFEKTLIVLPLLFLNVVYLIRLKYVKKNQKMLNEKKEKY